MRSVAVRSFAATIACAGVFGCLPSERLNDECRYVDPVATLSPPGDPARVAHLAEDMQVVHWLAIRHGDVTGPRLYDARIREARARCADASLKQIMRRHDVALSEIVAAGRARSFWIDLLAVYAPMAALFLFAARHAVARLLAGSDASEHALTASVLVFLMPVAAGFGLGATQMWAWLVESTRVRDSHISYRLANVPAFTPDGGWLLWQAGMALFILAVAMVVLRERVGAPAESRERGA